jgi:hypothetical protein
MLIVFASMIVPSLALAQALKSTENLNVQQTSTPQGVMLTTGQQAARMNRFSSIKPER